MSSFDYKDRYPNGFTYKHWLSGDIIFFDKGIQDGVLDRNLVRKIKNEQKRIYWDEVDFRLNEKIETFQRILKNVPKKELKYSEERDRLEWYFDIKRAFANELKSYPFQNSIAKYKYFSEEVGNLRLARDFYTNHILSGDSYRSVDTIRKKFIEPNGVRTKQIFDSKVESKVSYDVNYQFYNWLDTTINNKAIASITEIGINIDITGLSPKQKSSLIERTIRQHDLGIEAHQLFDQSITALIQRLEHNYTQLSVEDRKETLQRFKTYVGYRKQMENTYQGDTSGGAVLYRFSENSIENINIQYNLICDWIKDKEEGSIVETIPIVNNTFPEPNFILNIKQDSFSEIENRLIEEGYIVEGIWKKKQSELIAVCIIIFAKNILKSTLDIEGRIEKTTFKKFVKLMSSRYNIEITDMAKPSKIKKTFGDNYENLKKQSPFWLFNSLPHSPVFP